MGFRAPALRKLVEAIVGRQGGTQANLQHGSEKGEPRSKGSADAIIHPSKAIDTHPAIPRPGRLPDLGYPIPSLYAGPTSAAGGAGVVARETRHTTTTTATACTRTTAALSLGPAAIGTAAASAAAAALADDAITATITATRTESRCCSPKHVTACPIDPPGPITAPPRGVPHSREAHSCWLCSPSSPSPASRQVRLFFCCSGCHLASLRRSN